jgi:hypothetical protein
MTHVSIWRLVLSLKSQKARPVLHSKKIQGFDDWCTTEEGEIALALLFTAGREHEFGSSTTSGNVTTSFVLRKKGFYVKRVESASGMSAQDKVSYRAVNTTHPELDLDLDFKKFKSRVVAQIREKVDEYVIAEMSRLLLKQYKDRDRRYDELFDA